MKKVARIPLGNLADMAMLVAIAENFLDAMEHDISPEIPKSVEASAYPAE
jgi:hypothetical protein